MALKKIGYYLVKGKCLKVYMKQKKNRAGKLVNKKVNYRGKLLRKGTKVYKTKTDCLKALRKKMKKSSRSKGKKRVSTRSTRSTRSTKRSSFGKKSCDYGVPYFGTMVPSIAKSWSGTQDTGITSYAWGWPNPPSAKAVDMQQGKWTNYKN